MDDGWCHPGFDSSFLSLDCAAGIRRSPRLAYKLSICSRMENGFMHAGISSFRSSAACLRCGLDTCLQRALMLAHDEPGVHETCALFPVPFLSQQGDPSLLAQLVYANSS